MKLKLEVFNIFILNSFLIKTICLPIEYFLTKKSPNSLFSENNYLPNIINSYAPSIFLSDNNILDNKNKYISDKVKEVAINEIYNIAHYEKDLQSKKWFFSGYKVLESQKLQIFFTNDWTISPFSIVFNVYKTSKKKVINQLNQQLISQKHFEKNSSEWDNRQFVEKKAQKYWLNIHNFNNYSMFVDNENVIISFKRLEFKNWTKSDNISNNKLAILYFSYQQTLEQVKMIVELSDNPDTEKEKETNDYKISDKLKNGLWAGLAVILGFLSSVIIGEVAKQIVNYLFTTIGKTVNQIANWFTNLFSSNNPTDFAISEFVEEKLSEIITDKSKQQIIDKTWNKNKFNLTNNSKIIDKTKQINKQISEQIIDDLNNDLSWPDIPQNDIVDRVFKKIAQNKIKNNKWSSQLSKIKEKVKSKISEKIFDLEDFSSSKIDRLNNSVISEIPPTLEEELINIPEDLSNEIVESSSEIGSEIFNQKNTKFNDDFEVFLENYLDNLKKELLNNSDIKLNNFTFNKKQLTNSENSLNSRVKKILEIKLENLGKDLNILILDDYLMNVFLLSVKSNIVSNCKNLYIESWKKIKLSFNDFKKNSANDKQLIIKSWENLKPVFFNEVIRLFTTNDLAYIVDEKIINRLKKTIDKNENDLYKIIKSENISIFEPYYFNYYYIYQLQRIFKISTLNPKFNLSNFEILNNYFKNLFRNFYITKSWINNNVLNNPLSQKNILILIKNVIGDKIKINNQFQYLNLNKISIKSIFLDEKKLFIDFIYSSFIDQTISIKYQII